MLAALAWVSFLVVPCRAIMDIRHFALPNPPELVSFVDPGVSPPSYIFALDQLQPPYDISQPAMDPFPGCSASYGSLCSIQIAIRIVSQAYEEVCADLADPTLRDAALARIQNDDFNFESAIGFGVVAFLENGTILADALRPDLVGSRLDGYMSAGLVVQNWLLDYVTWVTSWGGGFVPHYTTRIAKEILDPLAGDAPLPASLYVQACPSGDRLGVAFGRDMIPASEPCDPKTNELCAMTNMRRLTGGVLTALLNSNTFEQYTSIFHQVSFTDDYTVGDFYIYVKELSWLGYPGPNARNPSPLEDNWDTYFAHGVLADTLVGYNVSAVVSDPVRATELMAINNYAAWIGGAAQRFQWWTPALGDHLKVALPSGVHWNGTAVLVGSGIVHAPAAAVSAPFCETCPGDSVLPCTLINVLSLLSHAKTDLLTTDGSWEAVSYDPWFGAHHADAWVNDKVGTWPEGFHVIAFDYNGTCVADGGNPANIGVNASDLFSDPQTHNEIIRLSDYLSHWLTYTTASGETRLAFTMKIRRTQRDYYLLVGTPQVYPALMSPCTSSYSEDCSNYNAEAIVGKAAAKLLLAMDETALLKVIADLEGGLGDFSESYAGDFAVHVYDVNTWECLSAVEAAGGTCPPTISEGTDALTSAVGLDANGWSEVTYEDSSVAMVFALRVSWTAWNSYDAQDLYVTVALSTTPGRPRCVASSAACPEHSTCSSSTGDGICECDVGYALNLSTATDTCGGLTPTEMVCVDVRGEDCTSTDDSTVDIDNCNDCAAGYFCPSGQPFVCPEGQYCPAGVSSPKPCLPGTFSSSTTQSECEACPVGHAAPEAAATQCSPCVAGTYAEEIGSLACTVCSKGTYASSSAQESCQACPAGTTTSAAGASKFEACSICEEGWVFKNYTCEECPLGFTTSSDDPASCSLRSEISGTLIVVGLILVFSSAFSFGLHRMYKLRLAALQAKADAATEQTVRRGLATIEDFGHPMVLMMSSDFMELSQGELRKLHEGNRNSHRLLFVDNYTKFQAMRDSGLKVIFLSYQWLSWTTKGPSDFQWEYMKMGVGEVIAQNKWPANQTYVWLDILSIPQEHRRVQSLAVDSLYVYAKCADALVVICPKTVHENTQEVADLASYQSRVWCRVEVLARCCTRGIDKVYLLDEKGMTAATTEWAANMVQVFDGNMTCCRQGHDGGTAPCNRLSLILPLLGLYYEGITREEMTPGLEFFEHTILNCKERVFPSQFHYTVNTEGDYEVHELFGDLIERVDLYARARTCKSRGLSKSLTLSKVGDSDGSSAPTTTKENNTPDNTDFDDNYDSSEKNNTGKIKSKAKDSNDTSDLRDVCTIEDGSIMADVELWPDRADCSSI